MKNFLSCVFLLIGLSGIAQQKGNPHYDFEDSIRVRYKDKPAKISWLMNDLSVSGYHKEAKVLESSNQNSNRQVPLQFSDILLEPARAAILREAEDYNVLMLNESHIRPEHRLFVKSLLKDLYEKGYRVLLTEGLQIKNQLNQNGAPTSKDGLLLNEPNYAQLFRYALKLGYTIEAYEYSGSEKWDDSVKLDKFGSVKYIGYNPPDSLIMIYDENGLKEYFATDNREQGQAQNAYAAIAKHLPQKTIMMVGEGHINETHERLGERLKKLLGMDVLTIEQTMLSDKIFITDTLKNDTLKPGYAAFIRYKSTRKGYQYNSPYFAADYIMANAIYPDKLGRPGYLFTDVEERKVYYPEKQAGSSADYLYAAYFSSEFKKFGNKAIAVDVLYVPAGSAAIPLLLYPGNYKLLRKHRNGATDIIDVKIP